MKSNKLSKNEFARALKLGHGRVLLHLRDYGDQDLEDVIVDALVNDYCFDRSMEGGRDEWLCKVLNVSNRPSFYARVCYELFAQDQEVANQIQQIELSGYFLELGFEKFRPLMLRKFRTWYEKIQKGPYCDLTILNSAGLFGLSYIVETVSAYPEKLDVYYSGMLLRSAIDEFYAEDLRPCIEKLRKDIPNAQAFFESCERFEEFDKAEPVDVATQPKTTIEDIFTLLRTRTHTYGGSEFKRFGRNASDDELSQIFHKLIHAANANELIYLFRVFESRALPSINESLLAHVDSENERVAFAAVNAFANMQGEIVRDKALSMLKSSNPSFVYRGLTLLEKNYETNHAGLIEDRLKILDDGFDIHSAGRALLRIAENFHDRKLVPLLIWMYENNPDTWCRSNFLELLHKWNALPSEILSESQWDAGDEVRYFSRRLLAENEFV